MAGTVRNVRDDEKEFSIVQFEQIPAILLALVVSIVLVHSCRTDSSRNKWATYRNEEVGLEFRHPASILTVSKSQGWIHLTHVVAHRHSDPCDFSDANRYLEQFKDFNVSLKMFPGGFREAVLTHESDFVTSRFLRGYRLLTEPGFIDDIRIGPHRGYRIQVGSHGCGLSRYYFPLDHKRTLLVWHWLVPEFSGSYKYRDRVLSLPGVITPAQAQKIFQRVVSSTKIID